ncbi:MAG: CDP-alcohol phosphatidyltransferase family protein, partial [Pseudorhodobacter sp.]|nr:CDP-alcohol phosphatidyltransferase family protein [Pseudorhodobacter sp.]
MLQPPKPRSELHLAQLLPNLMTISAMCSGLTGIRFAITDQFQAAVGMILVAAVLDGLDGRVARLLRSESEIGAELDSLVDFVN